MNALPHYIEPAHSVLSNEVDAEIERLCSDPTWEWHKRREVRQAAYSLLSVRWPAHRSWTYAMEGVPNAPEWKGEAFRAALMAGDTCEIGRLVRESVIREFALNCVEDAEKAWELGV